MTDTPTPRERTGGFTFAEILLATLIAALIALASIGLTQSVAQGWQATGDREGGADRAAGRAGNVLDRELAQALAVGHAGGIDSDGAGGESQYLAAWCRDDFTDPPDGRPQVYELQIFEVSPVKGTLSVWTTRPYGELEAQGLADGSAADAGELMNDPAAIQELVDGDLLRPTRLLGGRDLRVTGGGFAVDGRDGFYGGEIVRYAVRTDRPGRESTLAGTVTRRGGGQE